MFDRQISFALINSLTPKTTPHRPRRQWLLALLVAGATGACGPGYEADRGVVELDRDELTGQANAALYDGEALRGAVSATYGDDVNRYVPDVVRQFVQLRDHGELMGFYQGAGYPDTSCNVYCQNHWQGLTRVAYPEGASKYFLFASSHKDLGSYLAAVPHGGGKWLLGGNRMAPSDPDWQNLPDSAQTIASSTRMETYLDHPGGMQSIGRYVAIGVEKVASSAVGKVYLYDVGEMSWSNAQPRLKWATGITNSKVATASIVKLAPLAGETTSRYLMITAGSDSLTLTFNLSRPGETLTSPTVFSTTGSYTKAEGTLTPSSSTGWRPKYQTIQALVDESGRIYLLCANKTATGGADFLDLFKLDLRLTSETSAEGQPRISAAIYRAAPTKTMYCIPSISGAMTCDFSAAGGAYVDPNGRLYFYATVHDDDLLLGSSKQWTRLTEFRPRDHLDRLDTPAVEGCPTLASAWVSLYDGALARDVYEEYSPKGVNEMFIEFGERNARGTSSLGGYSSFAKAYSFNDRVATAQYCLPKGARFRLFQHENRSGASEDLVGTGTLSTTLWGNTGTRRGYSSACFLDSAGQCL